MNQKGITLAELVIVMVIIAICALLIAPNIGAWLPNYRLRSATRDVVSVLRIAQMKAVANNVKYGVAFDQASGSFQLYYTSGNLLPEGAIYTLPSGVQFSNITIPINATLGKPYAEFNTNSTASGGIIELTNTKGSKKTVRLWGTTGRVKIE
ncbi:MAG: pilus assembly FimT family protein [Thermodesulfobacteriota bacterium]